MARHSLSVTDAPHCHHPRVSLLVNVWLASGGSAGTAGDCQSLHSSDPDQHRRSCRFACAGTMRSAVRLVERAEARCWIPEGAGIVDV